MANRYRLTQSAASDLEEIGHYTQHRWGAARRIEYLAGLERRLEQLAERPRIGLSRDEIVPGLRSAQHGRHVIFYRPTEEGIVVSRILHSSMELRRHLRSTHADDDEH